MPGPSLPPVQPQDREKLLTDILKGVSRAFYLTLRVLPKNLQEPIGLAYLLARAADTIADTHILPPQDRLRHLLAFRSQVEGPASTSELQVIQQALTGEQEVPDERRLLESLPEAFALLEDMKTQDRDRIRKVVVTLTKGMELDLSYFPPEGGDDLKAFQEASELDNYIYYVAGCVGEFWTDITIIYSPPLKHWDVVEQSKTGIRFGKALQLTNVLRDLPKDLRIGRCYMPETELAKWDLTPRDLMNVEATSKARPILASWLRTALEHFEAAESYTLAIPRRCLRLRLAVLWPILIGLGTLRGVALNKAWLDPNQRSKVSRWWVYRMMILSLPASFSNFLLRLWMRRLRGQVEKAL